MTYFAIFSCDAEPRRAQWWQRHSNSRSSSVVASRSWRLTGATFCSTSLKGTSGTPSTRWRSLNLRRVALCLLRPPWPQLTCTLVAALLPQHSLCPLKRAPQSFPSLDHLPLPSSRPSAQMLPMTLTLGRSGGRLCPRCTPRKQNTLNVSLSVLLHAHLSLRMVQFPNTFSWALNLICLFIVSCFIYLFHIPLPHCPTLSYLFLNPQHLFPCLYLIFNVFF